MPDIEMSDDENATQFEDSDSDSDSGYNPFAYSHAPSFVYRDAPSESDTDSDSEDTNSPPIQLINTAKLWAKLKSSHVASKVEYILRCMDDVGLNLPIFLDLVGWGDPVRPLPFCV
ncbi:hypothetical protein K503DRAFT_777018, partial [Rhizopogon vinicolor AM-OR11-026]